MMDTTQTTPPPSAATAPVPGGRYADFWRWAGVVLKPDPARTVLKPFEPAYPEPYAATYGDRARVIIERLLTLDDAQVEQARRYLDGLLDDRHRDVRKTLLRQFDVVRPSVPPQATLSEDQELLIGGVFSEEYAFEAAALFNPSIVAHWDQTGLPPGQVRFILSLRGIGEGHVSSVTFRTGVWDGGQKVTVDPPSPYAESPKIEPAGADDAALSLHFETSEDLSEAVLFPMAPSQSRGIEDVRLVCFIEENGSRRYIATFTAFDGQTIRPEIFTTHRFDRFEMRPLTGKAARNKGMALFPRRIGGRYAMLGRQDNESIWLMRSDHLYHWDEAEVIVSPCHSWEFVQMGNCGSPIEIDEGWLVLTHGVGPLRNYTIGAVLLDRDDPAKVLARADIPLLRSAPEQRGGYVPNVVYSCGSLVMNRRILVPYGVADNFTSMVTGDLDALLQHLA